jgi:hypothetical protein
MGRLPDGNRKVCEDFFETPRSSIEPVLKYIPAHVKTVWEPTHGGGAITNVLRERGYRVIASDLYPKTDGCARLDFLTDEPDEPWDMLVFNPPFCLKHAFMKRALSFGKPVLFIAPMNILESQARFEIWREKRLSLIILRRRTQYTEQGQCTFHSAWVISDGQGRLYWEDNA